MERNLRNLVEPVCGPNGKVISITEDQQGSIYVKLGVLASTYSKEEVESLGGGDFKLGLLRLGQEAYKEALGESSPGYLRYFAWELESKIKL
jgi:hypothetical protein